MPFSSQNRALIVLASVVALQACASKTKVVEPALIDNSPLVKSAVVTTNIRNNGFKGQFANDTVHVRKTLDNIQRSDNSFRFTGSIMSRIGKKLELSEIIRLDKNLEWQLDTRKKRYRECGVGQCLQRAGYKSDLFSDEIVEQIEDSEASDSCKLTPIKKEFSIDQTGDFREINGFDTEKYQVNWEMGFEDSEGKQALNIITIDVWTTPETGELAEVIAIENKFAESFREYESSLLPENFLKAAPKGSIDMLVTHMLRYVDDVEKQELNELMSNASQIQGYPISWKFQWDAKDDTCTVDVKAEAPNDDEVIDTESVEGLLKSLGKQVLKQEIKINADAVMAEISMQPVLSITQEVESIEITEIRESELSVPPNYKLDNRS